ncbi:MAG: general secretion pathway protein GspK [Alphaproteobacteria bacterium]|nr:general secretion pathway protein GspK [Alphaproteobacteria bacterium]
MSGGDDGERGSIAILALWGVALIFMLIAPVAFATRGELRVASNALATSRARLSAEAGTQLGLVRLLRQQAVGAASFDGASETWQSGTTRVTIAIADEAGKIDLNAAPVEMLAGLFAGAGVPQEAAALIACNILDRRGDAAPVCSAADAPHQGRRFSVTEELAEIPGVGERLYDRIADSVTVATGASAIDPLVAPRPVLMAIPGATDSIVDDFLASRASLHDMGAAGAASIPAAAARFLMTSSRRDFTVVATATADDGARYRAELQIRLGDQGQRPYQVTGWRTPRADRGTVGAAAAHRAP